MKACTNLKCTFKGRKQPSSSFYLDSSRRDKLTTWCKTCLKARVQNVSPKQRAIYRKTALAKNPNYDKIRALKNKYGLSDEDISKVISGKAECKVCGSVEKICIDHCHSTGSTRGFLCTTCNTSLGLMKESPETLHKLAEYAQYCQSLKEPSDA